MHDFFILSNFTLVFSGKLMIFQTVFLVTIPFFNFTHRHQYHNSQIKTFKPSPSIKLFFIPHVFSQIHSLKIFIINEIDITYYKNNLW